MNDVSVSHIDSLYSYCSQSNCFISEITSVVIKIRNSVWELVYGVDDYIQRIEYRRDKLSKIISNLEDAIDTITDQIKSAYRSYDGEETSQIHYLEEKRDEYESKVHFLRNDLADCEDDLWRAEHIKAELFSLSSEISRELEGLLIDVSQKVDISVGFVKKYIAYLKDIQTV